MQGPYLNEPMAATDMELLLLNGVVDNDESHTFLEEYDEY
jgi:hypothetical protein